MLANYNSLRSTLGNVDLLHHAHAAIRIATNFPVGKSAAIIFHLSNSCLVPVKTTLIVRLLIGVEVNGFEDPLCLIFFYPLRNAVLTCGREGSLVYVNHFRLLRLLLRVVFFMANNVVGKAKCVVVLAPVGRCVTPNFIVIRRNRLVKVVRIGFRRRAIKCLVLKRHMIVRHLIGVNVEALRGRAATHVVSSNNARNVGRNLFMFRSSVCNQYTGIPLILLSKFIASNGRRIFIVDVRFVNGLYPSDFLLNVCFTTMAVNSALFGPATVPVSVSGNVRVVNCAMTRRFTRPIRPYDVCLVNQ